MTNKNIPSSKAIACFIKKNSPKNGKCIEVDFVNLNGLSVLAWVVEAPISNNQGYHKAIFSKIIDGHFEEPQSCVPCRYYKTNGTKIFTSSSFVTNPEAKVPLISVYKSSDNDSRVVITLTCKDRAFSQASFKERD